MMFEVLLSRFQAESTDVLKIGLFNQKFSILKKKRLHAKH